MNNAIPFLGFSPRFYLYLNFLFDRAYHHPTVVNAQRYAPKALLRYGAPNITFDTDPFRTTCTIITHLSDRLSFR